MTLSVRSFVSLFVTIFRNQLKGGHHSSRVDKEGTGESRWHKEGCSGVKGDQGGSIGGQDWPKARRVF